MINYRTLSLNFDNNNYVITGYSRSAVRTGLYLEAFDIMMDAGLYFDRQPKLVLVTHGHLDHINNLYSTLLDNIKKPTVLVPPKTKHHIINYIDAMHSVSINRKGKFDKYKMIELMRPSIFQLSKKFKIIPYMMDHRVDTIGYGIVIMDKKLNPEYIGLQQEELNEIRKSGKELSIINEKPFILFCGDTSSMILETLPFAEYKYVIIECTFLEPEHYHEALSRKHLHFLDLENFIKTNTETTFVLIHFSRRYKDEYIKDFFEKKNLTNVIPFI